MDGHLLRYNKKKTLVFIDCETFNLCLNKCHNLPWQIAMLKVNGDKSFAEKDFLLKWNTKLKIGTEAARITRYSQTKMDKDGVSPEEVFPTIKDWLDNADYIVGHNILGFDIYLIKALYEYMGEDYRHLTTKMVDTNCISRGVKYDLPYKTDDDFTCYQYKVLNTRKKGVKSSLIALGREFDIDHDYDNLHNALVDLKLNLKVWNKLKWQVDI
jgi:DNA polymerase III epsilon subunit-like protein